MNRIILWLVIGRMLRWRFSTVGLMDALDPYRPRHGGVCRGRGQGKTAGGWSAVAGGKGYGRAHCWAFVRWWWDVDVSRGSFACRVGRAIDSDADSASDPEGWFRCAVGGVFCNSGVDC